MPSTASRLRSDFESLTQRVADFIRDIPIEWLDRHGGGVILVAPDYDWGEPTDEQRNAQLTIKRDYEQWFEVFRSAFAMSPADLSRRIKKADRQMRKWIELHSNWELQPDPGLNEQKLWEDADEFIKILAILDAGGPTQAILVADTNAIIGHPDPVVYRSIAGDGSFVFLLLPTVLAELDALKNTHRNPDFREKVNKAITRVKGWRNQGSLRDGVTVDRTITVRAVAIEPDMQNTLKWLDKENRDDRIIAAVLEVQSAHPTAQVILVTGDINLLNKADVARIETAEMG